MLPRGRVDHQRFLMHLFASATVVLAALFASSVGQPTVVQDPAAKSGHGSHHGIPDRGTATTIAECMVMCEVCSHHCAMLAAEGKKEHRATHELLSDCAAICSVAASLAGHGSSLASVQLDACARACDTCASECEKFDDAMMKECAQSCRKCASACRQAAPPAKPAGR